MHNRLARLTQCVDFGLKWYIISLMVLLVALTFGQVFSRYVLQSSWTGTEEWSRLVLVWVTFMGAATAVRRNKLIRIDVFEDRFPPKVKSFLSATFDFILMFLCFVIIVKGWEAADITTSQVVAGTPFTYAWFVASVVVGSALIFVYLGLRRLGHLI